MLNGFKLIESVNSVPAEVEIVNKPLEESYVTPVTPAIETFDALVI